MLAGAHNPLAPDAGDNNGMDYDIIQGGAAAILVDYFIFCIFIFIFQLTNMNTVYLPK